MVLSVARCSANQNQLSIARPVWRAVRGHLRNLNQKLDVVAILVSEENPRLTIVRRVLGAYWEIGQPEKDSGDQPDGESIHTSLLPIASDLLFCDLPVAGEDDPLAIGRPLGVGVDPDSLLVRKLLRLRFAVSVDGHDVVLAIVFQQPKEDSASIGRPGRIPAESAAVDFF